MSESTIRLEFYGGLARDHQLDLYDAGRSIEGLGRTLSILGHFYENQKVLSKAPFSTASIVLNAPRSGSFINEVMVSVATTVLTVPVGFYLTYVMRQWLPGGAAADASRILKLKHALELEQERTTGLNAALKARDKIEELEGDLQEVKRFIRRYQAEHDVMRSISANSFIDIYRPIGRSADYALMYTNSAGGYTGVVDQTAVAQLDTEIADESISVVAATVDGFTRSSKRGTAFSKQLGRGFRFHYGQMGKLGSQDDFSWSQFEQQPLLMTGRFYKFFDGSIKRLEVTAVQRIDKEIEDLM